ncbi:MAG: SurA N-terminal domain-containing protein [Candidatus Omnitrophica bacterium]|nr:SurA N-terminal domain-containing protein [Candidatus Omnitrophota bacterium]
MRIIKFSPVFFLAVFILFAGCTKKRIPAGDIIAAVNGEPIYAQDLEKELAVKSAQDPHFLATPTQLEDFLQTMIDKRLLIQEAKKNRLDEQERFIHSIKLYWEQTLIRDLIQFKEKQQPEPDPVTEDDMKRYYENMSYRLTLDVVKRKDADLVKKLAELPVDEVKWDQEMGPLTYEDVALSVLAKAFTLAQGDKRILEDDGEYYLVYLKEKSQTAVAPYEELKDEIRKKATALARQQALKKWLDDLRTGSRIEVHRENLQRMKL